MLGLDAPTMVRRSPFQGFNDIAWNISDNKLGHGRLLSRDGNFRNAPTQRSEAHRLPRPSRHEQR